MKLDVLMILSERPSGLISTELTNWAGIAGSSANEILRELFEANLIMKQFRREKKRTGPFGILRTRPQHPRTWGIPWLITELGLQVLFHYKLIAQLLQPQGARATRAKGATPW